MLGLLHAVDSRVHAAYPYRDLDHHVAAGAIDAPGEQGMARCNDIRVRCTLARQPRGLGGLFHETAAVLVATGDRRASHHVRDLAGTRLALD